MYRRRDRRVPRGLARGQEVPMKVTSDKITDEQCRESGADPRDVYRATRKPDRHWTRSMRLFRKNARVRCAAAWNARHGVPDAR